ncbi:unnamed protein product [Meloidogyne enterolobii]|uniref:Uncharacterized protein n=1 Tax=Meloidogyne enterolobii TaxID=390850 RepID=A0ACB0ZPT0_MELEN
MELFTVPHQYLHILLAVLFYFFGLLNVLLIWSLKNKKYLNS